MKTISHGVLALAGLVAVATLTGCPQRSSTPGTDEAKGSVTKKAGTPAKEDPAPAKVLATVNGVPITEEELGFTLLGGHGRTITDNLKSKSLDRLIEAELIYQEGKKLGLDRDARYRRTVRALELRLAAVRRREMHRHLYNREVAAKVKVTEADARKYFDANAEKIKREYHLGMLEFEGIEQARALRAQLAAGKSFEELANGLSPQKAGAPRPPWDLGFLQWRQIPMEWVDAICSLSPGQVSEVVRGKKTGVRIFKLLAVRPLTDVTFEGILGSLMNRLRDRAVNQRYDAYLQRLRDSATIVVNNKS